VWAAARAKLAGMQSEGHDPTHGGKAAEARRASLARRRAAGEPLGRAAHNAKKAGTLPERPFTPPPLSQDEIGAAWQDAGEVWDASTQKALQRDRGQTLIVAGHGAGLFVDHDALIVKEGLTHYPQTPARHVLYRGVHGVERIILLAPSGSLSFDAIRWCQEQNITVIMVERDGQLLACLTPEQPGDLSLRRGQYMASATGRDVAVAQRLVRRKIQGQCETLVRFPALPGAKAGVQKLHELLAWFDLPALPPWLCSIIGVRTFEGQAAGLYFAAWKGYPLQWRKSARRYVPPHWQTIRERHSPLSDSVRRAVDPANAILNYAYGVLEGQCRQALTAEGLDTSCGFLHSDKQYRDSLVYDLMELYRPAVDALVLGFLGRTTFAYGDMVRATDGQCRLHPQLARAVVAGCRLEQASVDAGAKELRALLTAMA
jgi:CRISPR-associated endonuclease Cas1